MQSKVVRMLALALLLCGAGMISAQQPSAPPKQKAAPSKSKLEEMLAEALKNNPDIRVAAAKLAEADAELNRSRLQVMQKVVTLYRAIETQKKTVARWESEAKRINEMIKRGIVDPAVPAETENQLALAKGKLEELEAQLPALLGKSARAEIDARVQEAVVWRLSEEQPLLLLYDSVSRLPGEKAVTLAEWQKRHRATGPMAERLRKALQTPVKVDYKKMHFPDILKDLTKKAPGLSFRNLFADGATVGIPPNAQDMSLHFEDMLPVSAILQALADESGCRFYVREYGILVTVKENAPPGGMTIEEFLRQKPAEK